MSILLRLRPMVLLRYSPPVRSFSCSSALSEAEKSPKKAHEPLSACPANTALEGLAYLKDQPPVLALPDDQYPSWLWDLLKPKALHDDGPGGKAEKSRIRKARKQMIKEQNFMKTQ